MKTIPVGTQHSAIVDDEDYDDLAQFRWYRYKRARNSTAYAYRFVGERGNGQTWEYMHRRIVSGRQVDHANGDGLDNQRANLRECTDSQNRANTPKQKGQYSSDYKGVSWDRSRGRWIASIQVDRKHHHLGRFTVEDDAARAYDEAARRAWGEFARTNLAL